MPTEKTPSVHDRISPDKRNHVAEFVVDELAARVERRKDREKQWAEIDRQLAMQPETSHKRTAGGKGIDKTKAWMAETELPLQAQTLEMLTADARRLIFPKNRPWFAARAALTETYLSRYGNAGSPIPGERGTKAVMDQDNADMLVLAMLDNYHRQYDFRAHVDLINAQAFAYGFGVGRLRRVEQRILGHDMRVGGSDGKIPVLVPRDVKNTYLDDNPYSLMNEGYVIGPNIIQRRFLQLSDLLAASVNDDELMTEEIRKLRARKDGSIEVLELEGDVVVDDMIVRNVCVTVGIGEGKGSYGIIGLKYGEKFPTYLVHIYHKESVTAQPTSPLLKGMPIQMAASQGLNRLMDSSSLKITPPLGYDKDNPTFTLNGGPVVFPGAQWATTDEIKAYTEVGGDPQALFAVFQGLLALYADVTGVNPPRLGAQTKSHTTAFAKDVEISQGSIRTVDFVNSILEGPMTRLLGLEYRMGLDMMSGRDTIYVEPWNEFVTISKQHLPDIVAFKAIGSAAPAEDEARNARRLAAIQFALQIEAAGAQFGRKPELNLDVIIEQVLSDAGWDVGAVTEPEQPEAPVAGNGQIPGVLAEGSGIAF